MQLLRLDARDNIAVAIADLRAGDTATSPGLTVAVRDDVPAGHKVALTPIGRGADVIRYGEVIGAATQEIVPGEHVHVHNLISKRIPGREV